MVARKRDATRLKKVLWELIEHVLIGNYWQTEERTSSPSATIKILFTGITARPAAKDIEIQLHFEIANRGDDKALIIALSVQPRGDDKGNGEGRAGRQSIRGANQPHIIFIVRWHLKYKKPSLLLPCERRWAAPSKIKLRLELLLRIRRI